MNSSKQRHWNRLGVVIFLILFIMVYAPVHAAEVQNKLINFQGFLTDNAEPSNPLDGTYDITFKIYKNQGDATNIWLEQHQDVAIIKGNVSVLLGSLTPMNIVFDEPLYLGIQIDTEPEMTPRQKLMPAFHATAADKLVVKHADESKSEFGINRITPIGLIAPYFGDPANLPDNWKVCDGSEVDDPESPLNGKILPDLRQKFVRGEAEKERDTSTLEEGGSDSHNHTIQPHNHSVTINNSGSHNHSGVTGDGGSDHTHGIYCSIPKYDVGDSHMCGSGSQDCADNWHKHDRVDCSSGGASSYIHAHTISADGDHTHSATIANTSLTTDSTSNIPKYVALHYIIRIK